MNRLHLLCQVVVALMHRSSMSLWVSGMQLPNRPRSCCVCRASL